jgi:hypothetical protein
MGTSTPVRRRPSRGRGARQAGPTYGEATPVHRSLRRSRLPQRVGASFEWRARATASLHSDRMRRRPSLSLRALRCLVVLVTVWCTGCSGYEPSLDAALGRSGVGMDCASEDGAPTAQTQAPTAGASADQAQAAAISVLPMSSGEKGFSCGCTSCHAVTLASWSFTPLAAPAIALAHAPELPLVSVERVPLLPPPELTVA